MTNLVARSSYLWVCACSDRNISGKQNGVTQIDNIFQTAMHAGEKVKQGDGNKLRKRAPALANLQRYLLQEVCEMVKSKMFSFGSKIFENHR